jgi:hypothetical protein
MTPQIVLTPRVTVQEPYRGQTPDTHHRRRRSRRKQSEHHYSKAIGPVLLQNYQLIEKLAHQNLERIEHDESWGPHDTCMSTIGESRLGKSNT